MPGFKSNRLLLPCHNDHGCTYIEFTLVQVVEYEYIGLSASVDERASSRPTAKKALVFPSNYHVPNVRHVGTGPPFVDSADIHEAIYRYMTRTSANCISL